MSDLLDKDKRYTWHPFTQHATEVDPIVITHGKNASLFTEDGQEILDMISSWWTCTHGHAHPELNKALADQASTLEHVMFAGFTHPKAVELAEKLSTLLLGGLNRTFFSDNGSTAVEVSLKLAYQYWHNKGETQRTKFIAFENAYHGDTFGAMSVGEANGFFTLFEDLMFSVDTIPYPATWLNDAEVSTKEEQSLDALQKLIDDNKDEIAAIILEPLMQGAGGIRHTRPSFVKELTELCQSNNILVIFDEVAVGFGRMGTLFACEKIGVTPDMICLSKALTAGYLPMSVTVVQDKIFDAFLGSDFKRAFAHGHSFTANPLACAVALRSLEIFEEDKTIERIQEIEALHLTQVERLNVHPFVHQTRVMGSCLAFNVKDPSGEGYKSQNTEILRDYFLKNGFNIRPMGSAVYLMPPYCITDEELRRAYDIVFEGLALLETKVAA